jgi:hypothetical protein
MRFTHIFIVFLALLPTSSYANKEIERLTLPIMESIHKGEINEIFSMTFPKGSPGRKYFSESDMQHHDNQFKTSFQTLGKSNGYFEYLHSDIPDVFVLKYYLVKFDLKPAIIKFSLYNPDGKWRINSLELVDMIAEYLDESAKYRMGSLGHIDVREDIKANKSNQQD